MTSSSQPYSISLGQSTCETEAQSLDATLIEITDSSVTGLIQEMFSHFTSLTSRYVYTRTTHNHKKEEQASKAKQRFSLGFRLDENAFTP